MMTVDMKKAQYELLCKDVKNHFSIPRTVRPGNNEIQLEWNTQCNEINFWTYWQGRGSFNPKIMLVGQDWGCPADLQQNMNNIEMMNQGQSVRYMHQSPNLKKDLFPTDLNLISLFQSIGYDIDREDRNPDLFFTNLILGYRNNGSSGGYTKSWLSSESKEFFRRQIEILEPTVILCLGRSTFEGVLSAAQIKCPKIHTFNEFIESNENPVRYQSGNKNIHIFALAHCGKFGTINRNKEAAEVNKAMDLELQKKDWQKIKAYLQS